MKAKREALVGLMVVAAAWAGSASAAPTKAQVCEAAKATAAGKLEKCLADERAKEVKGKSFDYAKCDAAFIKAFTDAESKAGPGVCPTEGDAAAIAALIDTCFEDIQNGSSVCAADLATCTADLDTCNTDLTQVQAALTQAETDLGTCNTNLTQAQTDLAICQATAQHLPATGQTTCRDSAGAVIPCENTGHDGDIQAGATLSYTDNGDGTITDNNTGLMWEKKSDDGTIHDKDTGYTWADAFAVHIAGLNAAAFAGYTDWRLPNVKELQSIVNYGALSSPAVSSAFNTGCAAACTVLTCSCTATSFTWSSTTNAGTPAFGWVVQFSGGNVLGRGKTNSEFVRAVRGGL